MYGASAALGFGGSMLLVTVLTMLADLIGQNVVKKLSLRTRGGLLGGWGGGVVSLRRISFRNDIIVV